MAVNQERLKLLTDALESGEFKQAQKMLRIFNPDGTEHSYCCLGVATVVALRNGLVDEDPVDNDLWSNDEIMHGRVAEWYGFPDENPDLTDRETDQTDAATEWNDGAEASFLTIARLFRETYGVNE